MPRLVVLDTNITIALVVALPYSAGAIALYDELIRQDELTLLAPPHWSIEVVSVIREMSFRKAISRDEAMKVLDEILRLPITTTSAEGLGRRAYEWAELLRHAKAYDGAFLAFCEIVGAEFYTADERLYNAAKQSNATFIHRVK
jgi:predicted nucleic acid-binding protein